MMYRLTPFLVTVLIVLLGGCATPAITPVPAPLPVTPASLDPRIVTVGQPITGTSRAELREQTTPAVSDLDTPVSAGVVAPESLPPGLTGQPVSVNFTNVPLPTFINDVLGNALGLTFQMDPDVQQLSELVTLRTSRPQSPVEFYRLSRQVLADYGVEMVAQGSIVRLRMAPAGARIEPPIIYSGRALPDVPLTHRPIFYFMQLNAIRANEAARWLKAIYGDEVTAEESSERNALLLSGRPEQIRQAIEAIRVFDRPSMRGRASIRLEPAFMNANELAGKLTEVLVAEGYGASTNLGVAASILVMPVPAVNSVIVFASDHSILRHAISWARELDRPNPAAGGRSVFYYPVQTTKAADIASVLGGAQANTAPTASPGATADPAGPGAPPDGSRSGAISYSLIVDEPRNALIFQGDPAEWERLLPLVRQMDKEARQVMIEVTIAEVSLDDNEEFGVSWFAKSSHGRFDGRIRHGTLPSTDTGGSTGLTYLLDVAGQSRALLRAFADDQRVTILSTPRLMVKSGEEANIDVGTEVPIITSRNTSPQQTEGSTGLLQSIQYRKTGIILSIKPTVYSNDRVDLQLSQEVSEALPVSEGDEIGSPSIFNRSVQTSLSLRDGGSIVIGGLMSQRQSNSDSGVPYIKDIPLLGNLFKTQSRRTNKTELVLMIVPYIIGSDERAAELTRAIGDELELLQLPSSGSLMPAPLPVPSSPSPVLQAYPLADPEPAIETGER